MSDTEPQKWMHPNAFFALLLVALPFCIYLPTHLVLARLFCRQGLPNTASAYTPEPIENPA